MPNPKRKRFNAFDDFPAEESAEARADKANAILPSKGDLPAVTRIENLKPSQMLPDRFQPRRLLPEPIRSQFFSGQINCYQAASEWLNMARQDNSHRGEIDRLLSMGGSFEAHGQIKPVTGSWATAGNGEYIFMIETGERRFWAACLHAVSDKLKDEPVLRVEVIEHPTRQRQVLENRHAEPPSAVGQACEVASLILSELNIAPDPNVQDEYDYFRQANTKRMPAGLWEKIMPIMQLTRPRMVQLLNILHLPTPLLELADRYRLPERVLREILSMPRNQWERVMRVSIQNKLTSDDLAEFKANPQETEMTHAPRQATLNTLYPGRAALSGLRRFANAIMELDEVSQAQAMDEVADVLITSNQAEGMSFLLGELGRMLDIRLAARKK